MTARTHPTRESLRASLWFWPSVAAAVSFAVALALSTIRADRSQLWALWAWPADAASATALLQTVATATMAATTLTFSLTVVALQLSSQQFSPRLLREFSRNKVTQVVLGLLVSTFVVALTGLRGIREGEAQPVAVIALATVMAIASVGALLGFIGNLVRSLRVDTMMVTVRNESAATIADTYGPSDPGKPDAEPLLHEPGTGRVVPASRSGFVRVIDPGKLVAAATRHGVSVQVAVRPGDQVIQGSPLAEFWSGSRDSAAIAEAVRDDLEDGVDLAYERTLEQDAAFGFRQLTDIAVKAISPGINDPVTAVHAVGYCADLLIELQSRRLGPKRHHDDEGRPVVLLPDRDIRYYLDLVCSPLRRYGEREPLVLMALLRMLRDCAASAQDDEQRGVLRQQADLVVEQMSPDLLDADARPVRAMHASVVAMLEGDAVEAYRDRAGETRSV